MSERKVVKPEDVLVPEELLDTAMRTPVLSMFRNAPDFEVRIRLLRRDMIAAVLAHLVNYIEREDSAGKIFGSEWFRIAFLKPEPEYPAELKEMFWAHDDTANRQLVAAYELGKKAGTR